MKINNYKNYLFEGVDTKGVRMFYSEDFKNLLMDMTSPIALDILDLLENDVKYAYSYITLSNESDKISILPVGRLSRIDGVTEKDLTNPSLKSPVWGPYGRNNLRIGAFIIAMLPKYNGKTKETGDFLQEFIGKQESSKFTMDVVQGEAIRKWYLMNNYYNPSNMWEKPEEGRSDPRSVLVKSCMKQPEKQPFFDIYVKNPNQCKMLVMLNKSGKLVARALLWIDISILSGEENSKKVTFMDRIYYTDESDVSIFKDYAKKEGWVYKTEQTKDCETIVMDGKSESFPMVLRLENNGYFPKYPYLDTLCFYTPDTGRLSNYKGNPGRNKFTYKYGTCEPGEIFTRLQLRKIGGGFLKLLPK